MEQTVQTYRATVKRHNGSDVVEVWDNGQCLGRRYIAADGLRPGVLDRALERLGYERVTETWTARVGLWECRCRWRRDETLHNTL